MQTAENLRMETAEELRDDMRTKLRRLNYSNQRLMGLVFDLARVALPGEEGALRLEGRDMEGMVRKARRLLEQLEG